MDPNGVIRGVPANATTLSDANIKLNVKDVKVTSSWGARNVTLKDTSGQKVELSMAKFMELAKGEFDKINKEVKATAPGKAREEKLTEARQLLDGVVKINDKEKNAFLGTAKRDAVIDEMKSSIPTPRADYRMKLGIINHQITNLKNEILSSTDSNKSNKLKNEVKDLESEKNDINKIIEENWGDYDYEQDMNARDKARDVRDQGNV